jgi:hypothetical protein
MPCNEQRGGIPAWVLIIILIIAGGVYHELTQRVDLLENRIVTMKKLLEEKGIIKDD